MLSSSNFELLSCSSCTRPIPLLVLGYKFFPSGTSCVGLGDLAGREGPLRLGFVKVLLQPIFTGLVFVVGTDNGASASVGDGPAPAARCRSRRVLAVAPMANHNWPSSILPHGVAFNISLRATFFAGQKTVYEVDA